MDKTRDVITAFALDRHDVTAVPDGDDGLPEELGVRGRRNDLLEGIPDLTGLDPLMTADIGQLRTCVISNLLFRQNGAEDPVLQIFIGSQATKQLVENRRIFIFGGIRFYRACAAKYRSNSQKLLGAQCTAPVRPLQRGGNIF